MKMQREAQEGRISGGLAPGRIDWTMSGRTDFLVGTGADRSEVWLGYASALLLTGVIVWMEVAGGRPLLSWQILVVAILAFDIAGGAVANMLNSCKRFYHVPRPRNGGLGATLARSPIAFTAVHVQPLLAAWLLGGSMLSGLVWYAALQVAVWLTMASPLHLRRAVATLLTLLAILAHQAVPALGIGLAWFVPCIFIKLVMGHAVQEEPYRAPRRP